MIPNNYVIYQAIKSILPNNFKITLGDIDDKAERVVSLYIKSGSSYARTLRNNIIQWSGRLVFNIHASNSNSGIKEGLDYCNTIAERLTERVGNGPWLYVNEDGENIVIMDLRLIEGINMLGKNSMSIPRYSINFMIKYGVLDNIEGGKDNGIFKTSNK